MSTDRFGIAFPGQGVKQEAVLAALKTHQAHPVVARLGPTFGVTDLNELDLDDTAVTQPTTFALGIAAVESALGPDPKPPLVLGHSLGELTAAVCAGILDVESGFQLALRRGALCREQNARRPGSMIAVVGTELDDVEWLRRRALARDAGILEIAGINSRRQAVLSGDRLAIERAVKLAEEQYVRVEPLPIAGAFHSPLMLGLIPEWRKIVESVEFRPGTAKFISSIDARLHEDPDDVQELLVRSLVMPVRWRDAVRTVRDLGVVGLFDAGPGDTLLKLGQRERMLEFAPLTH